MEKRLSNIFKNYKRHEVDKGHSKISYRVLQVTPKWKTLEQPVYFLRAVDFWSTFDS